MVEAQPRRLSDRYALGEPIGYGGMAQVYRAHDEVLDRDVAVKLLRDDAFDDDGDLTRASLEEARAAARLTHPGIVHVFDVGSQEGTSFVVMELVPGRSLQRLIRERGRLAAEEAIELTAQVADALAAVHRAGLVHLDVKPNNVLVTPDGRAKLADFGIARAASGSSTLPKDEIRGSAAYLAPEQVRGERVDGRTDIYALGAVLYELLTGRPPFTAENTAALVTQRLVTDPPPPRSINPDVPTDLDAIVLRALAREPEGRFASADEFRDALRSSPSSQDPANAVTQVIPSVPAQRTPRTRPTRIARTRTARDARLPWDRFEAWINGRERQAFVIGIGAVLLVLIVAAAIVRLQSRAPVAPGLVGHALSEVPALVEHAGLASGDVTVLTRPVEAGYVGKVVDQQPQPGLPVDSSAGLQIAVGVPNR